MEQMLNLKNHFEAEMTKQDEPVIERDHDEEETYLKQMKNYKQMVRRK